MATCVFDTGCQGLWQSTVDGLISRMASTSPSEPLSLFQAYKTIAQHARNATIIVMGYPRYFTLVPPLVCFTGLPLGLNPGTFFTRPQMIWIDSEIQKMDTTIQNAVTAAQQAGYRVRYVGSPSYDASYNAFTGHEMCTSDPYYNVVALPPLPLNASFHPNQSGNARMAQLVEQTYEGP